MTLNLNKVKSRQKQYVGVKFKFYESFQKKKMKNGILLIFHKSYFYF